MKQNEKPRRAFVKNAIAGMGLLSTMVYDDGLSQAKKKKIVCVGGHPDDPESGCGGTLAKFSNAGHDVTIIYLTTGDAGIDGKSLTDAAAIRKQEAINACKILKAKPIFAGQIDGDTIFNNEWVKKLQSFITTEQPDIVFTHWPLDSHKDHQVASLLTVRAWMHSDRQFHLYFFEVLSGMQTMVFHPTDYVDITVTRDQKKKAVYCHTSQHPNAIYAEGHEAMEHFRGLEMGSEAAEGFVRMNGRNSVSGIV